MRRITATVGALFIFIVVYLVVLFFARNLTDGLGLWADAILMVVVGLVALVPAKASYRASMMQRQ